jgi:hypothetical protein
MALMTKSWKKLQLKKNYDLPIPRKNVQVTEEAFSSQKRPSNTLKHEVFLIFSTYVGHFALLDPDPLTRLNPDLIGIRIRIRNPVLFM